MKLSNQLWLTWALLPSTASAFTSPNSKTPLSATTTTLSAAPKRLEENAEGVVFVNDRCINCAACANFAPSVFKRADQDYAHIVHHQPASQEEILDARAAMAACPVAAIRSETLAQRRHRAADDRKAAVQEMWTKQDETLVKQMALSPKVNGLELPFPRPLMYHDVNNNNQSPLVSNKVYNVGHHNEKSFGATPYLVQAQVNKKQVWFLVDTPKFGKSALEAVISITGESGPDYLFLTHVDDTADHDKWVEEFPALQRIFHQGDTGRHNWLRDSKLDNEVEILLSQPTTASPPEQPTQEAPLYAYSVDGTPLPSNWHSDFIEDGDNDVVVLHTPGHSPGSITLWKKPTAEEPGIIFTGDHYAYTSRTGRMSGFPRYGNNLQVQAKSLQNLLQLDWDIVAPGHGHPRDYSQEQDKEKLKRKEMEEALMDLHK